LSTLIPSTIISLTSIPAALALSSSVCATTPIQLFALHFTLEIRKAKVPPHHAPQDPVHRVAPHTLREWRSHAATMEAAAVPVLVGHVVVCMGDAPEPPRVLGAALTSRRGVRVPIRGLRGPHHTPLQRGPLRARPPTPFLPV
jgi:hypothetical protein